MSSNKNPIYVEYYSHEKCDCYKIDLPWSKYEKHTLVLCHVSEGLKRAEELTRREILKHLDEALIEPIIEGK